MGRRDQDRGHQGRVRSYPADVTVVPEHRLAPRLAMVLNPRLPHHVGAAFIQMTRITGEAAE